MKTETIGKRLYTEKITQVPSGWCKYSTFAYGDVSDSLKMYHVKDFVEKTIQHIEDKVKWLSATFTKQPMAELPDALKREL